MIIIADIYERSELRVTSAGLCGCVYRTVLYISETTVYNIKGEGDAHIISIGDYSILVEGLPQEVSTNQRQACPVSQFHRFLSV